MKVIAAAAALEKAIIAKAVLNQKDVLLIVAEYGENCIEPELVIYKKR